MIAIMINLTDVNYDTPITYDSSVLSIMLFLMVSIAILLEIYVISEHNGRYHLKEFTLTYGSIVEGLNTESIFGRYWNILTLIRWAATNFILVFLRHNCAVQIFVLLGTSVIFQMLIIIAKPINDIWDQRITLLIEACVSIYLYGFLSLTDYMGENTQREEIGWLLVMLTGSIVAINVSVLFFRCIRRAFIYISSRV
jgi:hypothetical protein